jgi:hypothetical protein
VNLHNIVWVIRFWTTSTGLRIPVEELGDDHIVNIVNMFGRTPRTSRFVGVEREMMLSAVVAEGDRRGILEHMGVSG